MMIKRLPGFVLSAICVIALAGCAGGYGNAGGAAALAGASTGSATVGESSANSEESAATIEQSSATVEQGSAGAAAPAAPVAQGPAPAPAQAPAASAGTITMDEAKKIALKQAGISSENSVIFTETSFEYDDGRAEYQIDFIYGTTEYEVEIDATTGAIIEYDVESIYD